MICVSIAALTGCGSEQDPVAQMRVEVRKSPDSLKARLDLADAYVETEAYHDAFIQYSKAYQLDKTSFPAVLGLARAQERLNDVDGAVERVNEALEINPGAADALALKGKLLLREGRNKAAIETLEEALQGDPDAEDAHRFLPVAYLRTEQPAKAEQAARTAAEHLPDSVDVRINLASALLVQDKADEAEAVLRKAMELDPADPTPPLRLAELLVREGRGYDEVMQLTTRSTELDPGQGEADAVAALALRQQGRNDEAIRRLHSAAMAHPRNVRLWLMLSAIYRDMGEEEAAARAAGMAFRFAPRRRVRSLKDGDEQPGSAADLPIAQPSPSPAAAD